MIAPTPLAMTVAVVVVASDWLAYWLIRRGAQRQAEEAAFHHFHCLRSRRTTA
jgi:hypothetical protein